MRRRRLPRAMRTFALALGCLVGASCGGGDGITVTGGTVAGLRFTVHPSTAAAGAVFSVTVELITSNGQRAATATNVIQLSISGGASLAGGTSKAAAAGVATFDGLSVIRAGTGYQITASAAGFTTSSNAFAIAPATASAAQSTVSVTPATIAAGTPATATFTFKDSFGNIIPGAAVNFATNLVGATFNPSSGTTDTEGKFTTTFLATVAGNAILTITVAGTEFAFATPFIVGAAANPCTPVQLTIPGTANGAISASSCTNNTPPTSPADLGTALFRFTLGATTAAHFTVTSTFAVPQLEVLSEPPGNQVAVFDNSSTGSLGVEWLLPAGTYTARVASRTAANGTFTIAGASRAIGGTAGTNGTCYLRLLVVSVTLNQSLGPTDCPWDNPADGSFYDYYAIKSFKPCVIAMTSATLLPWLEVRDVDGNVLFATIGVGTPSTATLNLAQCSNGTSPIILYANAVPNPLAGDYTLTFTITGGGSDTPPAAAGPGTGLVADLHGILNTTPPRPGDAPRKPTPTARSR